jgi:sterol carrier protein 2
MTEMFSPVRDLIADHLRIFSVVRPVPHSLVSQLVQTFDMSHSKVYIIGVGVTEFLKPRGKVSYTELGLQASVKALIDCDLTYDSIQQAYCGYIYGDSTCGQRVLYQLGLTQIPIINVNNNCSTGSTALWMGRNAIRGGGADCVLCVGWEQMEAGIFHGCEC